jgi:hypothetical protein
MLANDPDGTPVALTDEDWRHILARHGEMASHLTGIAACVSHPTHIVPGRSAREVWHYLADSGPSRYLKVVIHYHADRGYVRTAFGRRRFP